MASRCLGWARGDECRRTHIQGLKGSHTLITVVTQPVRTQTPTYTGVHTQAKHTHTYTHICTLDTHICTCSKAQNTCTHWHTQVYVLTKHSHIRIRIKTYRNAHVQYIYPLTACVSSSVLYMGNYVCGHTGGVTGLEMECLLAQL